VRPSSDGSFRVAFAPGTTAGLLLLDARFLYLEREPVIYDETSEAVARALLGGSFAGE
jgi:hypothetical protein